MNKIKLGKMHRSLRVLKPNTSDDDHVRAEVGHYEQVMTMYKQVMTMYKQRWDIIATGDVCPSPGLYTS